MVYLDFPSIWCSTCPLNPNSKPTRPKGTWVSHCPNSGKSEMSILTRNVDMPLEIEGCPWVPQKIGQTHSIHFRLVCDVFSSLWFMAQNYLSVQAKSLSKRNSDKWFSSKHSTQNIQTCQTWTSQPYGAMSLPISMFLFFRTLWWPLTSSPLACVFVQRKVGNSSNYRDKSLGDQETRPDRQLDNRTIPAWGNPGYPLVN